MMSEEQFVEKESERTSYRAKLTARERRRRNRHPDRYVPCYRCRKQINLRIDGMTENGRSWHIDCYLAPKDPRTKV